MTEMIPDNRNRFAYAVSVIFHPLTIGVLTMLAVVREMPLNVALMWGGLLLAILFGPLIVLVKVLEGRGEYVFQREVRRPLYLVGGASLLVCLALTLMFDAPDVLVACMLALAVWVPLQFAINSLFTKISIHTAVISGCFTALVVLGVLNSPPLIGFAVGAVLLTAWSRIVTRNHTVAQVALGILVGALPVLIVFPLVRY